MVKQQDEGHRRVEVELSLDEISALRREATASGMNVMKLIELVSRDFAHTEGKTIVAYFKKIDEALSSVKV